MTVADLKGMIEDLPDDMLVIMPVGEGIYLATCKGQSGVMNVEFPEVPAEQMLVIVPCNCKENMEYVPTEICQN